MSAVESLCRFINSSEGNNTHQFSEGNIFRGASVSQDIDWLAQAANINPADRMFFRNTHNTGNEVESMRAQLKAGLNPERLHEYPYNQVKGLLTEFAGKMGNTAIYSIVGGRLYAPGNAIPTGEMFARYASKTQGARECADAQGFAAIESALLSGDADMIVQLSPPSVTGTGEFVKGFGGYGFINLFRKEGTSVTSQHLMYQEDEQLTRSQELAQKLGSRIQSKSDASVYLTSPISIERPHSLDHLFDSLDMGQEWAQYTKDKAFFNTHIMCDPQISRWMQEYINIQVGAASGQHPFLTIQSEAIAMAMYRRAREIFDQRARLATHTDLNKPQRFVPPPLNPLLLFASPLNMQDGSCPINSGRQFQNSLYTPYGLNYTGLSHALFAEPHKNESSKWRKTDCITCPMCNDKGPHFVKGSGKQTEYACRNSHCKGHKKVLT